MTNPDMVRKRIPQCNPKANYLSYKADIDIAVAAALDNGRYILGDNVSSFEKEYAEYVGVKHCIGVGSGTEAIHLALRTIGIGAGDEVITVSHTAVATVAAIEMAGASPVLVDVDPETFLMDLNKMEKAVTPRTKAIITVHLYGQALDMERVMSFARSKGINVIEDCAQSHGASFKGDKTGAFGMMSAFSFYPTKNLGAIGDGGAVVTNDKELAEKAKAIREYGWKERYISSFAGFNSRLDEIQAAILRIKLKSLDKDNARRRAIAKVYDEMLADSSVRTPFSGKNVEHVYHQYVVKTGDRDALRKYLSDNGIDTLIHYPVPVHKQPAYSGRVKCGLSMENTEKICGEILSLPIFPELTADDAGYICETIKKRTQ